MLKRQIDYLISDWQFQFESDPIEAVTTPHSWNALDTMRLDDATWFRRGIGTYTTALTTKSAERTFVRFGAASQKAVVYWNERKIGHNEGGYLPFTVELPQGSSGILRAVVDNSPDPHLPPSDRSDFFLYGGLTRPVTRYTTGPQRIVHLHTDAQVRDGAGELGLIVHVDGALAGLTCSVRVIDPSGETVIVHEQAIEGTATAVALPVVADPQLWSPDAPHLYHLHASVAHNGEPFDAVRTHFGWRTFDFPAGGPFYLNGERLLLRGTHRHEDWAGCASAVSEADTRAEFENMKACGMNFIRLGHYPQSDFVHTLCDELGLIVWDELPWCRGGVGGDLFKARTRTMLRTMIAEHRHHPSIIFWGMGNELDWVTDHIDKTDDDVFAFLQEINALTHDLDPTRLTALRRYERGATVVAVYSPSIWSGWYRGRYQDYELALSDAQEKFPRMLHIEWSADNHIGRHNTGPHLPFELKEERDHAEQDGLAYSTQGFARASRDGDWSESYFLDLAAWTLRVQQEQPNFAGAAQWAFKDFGTPLRPENPIPYINQKGIVDRKNRPKTAFYLFQAAQTETPVCHIESHSWPVRVGALGEKQRVRVITNCACVELFLNDKSQGTRRDGWLRAWHLDLPEGDNTFRAVGTTADGHLVEDTLTQRVVFAAGAFATQWRAEMIVMGDDVRVTVQMVDAHEKPVVAPEQRVTFGLEGTGRLDVDLGTIDGSRTVSTANGRATIMVRDIGVEGAAVTVTSEFLPFAVWTLR